MTKTMAKLLAKHPYSLDMDATNKTLTDDQAARKVAKLLCQLRAAGHDDLAKSLAAAAQKHLSK